MKRLFSLLAILVLLIAPVPKAVAQESVSMDFFYDNLQPYGNWREIGSYGYCWQPRGVDADWRPFSEGRWVYTDAGWTWDSDEAFGWAVYHYGRWANVGDAGWFWVPGMEWGPGWVSWRHSPSYVGWAPLPPEAHFRRETGFRGWVDDYFDIGPSNYCFVEAHDFGARRLRSVFIDSRRNLTIIRQTTNITNIHYENHMIHNDGPQFDSLSKVSRNPIARYKLDRRQRFEEDPRNWREEHGRSRVSDDLFSLFAPAFSGHTKEGPRNSGPKISNAEVNHGWRHAGSEPEIEELRKAIRSNIKPPDDLPREPRFVNPSEPTRPRGETREPKEAPPSRGNPRPEQSPRPQDHPSVTPDKRPKQSETPHVPDPDKSKPKDDKGQPDKARPKDGDHKAEPEVRKAHPVDPKPRQPESRREPEVRAPKAESPKHPEEKHPKQKQSDAKPPQREPKPDSKPDSKPESRREPKRESKPESKRAPKQPPAEQQSSGPKKPKVQNEDNEKEKDKEKEKGKGKKKDS